jgi:hypothetical protein
MGLTLEDLSVPAPEPGPLDWNDTGVVILHDALNPDVVADYCAEWEAANGPVTLRDLIVDDDGAGQLLQAEHPGGWDDCTPYMRYPALMAMCCGTVLADALADLLGEPAGVHLNLTGWVSTERNWHQDGYLNPPEVGDHYAAVWMALGDVHPDSGPFQYVPGSHRWHRLVRERFEPFVDMADPTWPKATEDILTPLLEAKLADEGHEVVSYVPNEGDVLIWHPRLYHRGSTATVKGMYRPALIAHYSGIDHRPDMPAPERHPLGGYYFPIADSGPVR